MPLINNSDKVRVFQVALSWACFASLHFHCGRWSCRRDKTAIALIAPPWLEMANNEKKAQTKKTQTLHATSGLFEIEINLLWLSICLLSVCFPHTFEQLSFTSTNVQEKWISKLLTVLTESLFKSSQNYFCWEIISTQLIAIQIYFRHKDCLSLAITLASIIAACEPLPPKINSNNKLPQGLSLMLCLYNACTIR